MRTYQDGAAVEGCSLMFLGGFRGIWGVFWLNVCTYHKVYAPCLYGQWEGRENTPHTPLTPQNIKLHPLYSSTILVSSHIFIF